MCLWCHDLVRCLMELVCLLGVELGLVYDVDFLWSRNNYLKRIYVCEGKYIWWSSILLLNSYIYVVWIELLQYWLITSNHVRQNFNLVPWMIGPDFSWLEKISIVFLTLQWKSCFWLSHSFSPLSVKCGLQTIFFWFSMIWFF